jgi:hypothetical protein
MDLDVDPKIFALLINWVYYQSVTRQHGQELSIEDYFYLWIMADRFLVPRLQNAVVKGFWYRHRPHRDIQNECVQYVYRNTREGSPLRRLLLQCFMIGDSFRLMPGYLENYPHEMLLEMHAIVVKMVPENIKVEGIKTSDLMVSEELPSKGGALSSSDESL